MRTKIIALEKDEVAHLLLFGSFLLIAISAPLLGNQLLVGPIVNAILFLAVIFFGIKKAFLVALLPSFMAFFVGILPIGVFAMIPYIIIGNLILVTAFNYFKKRKEYFAGVFCGAFLKFIFLSFVSFIFVGIISSEIIFTEIFLAMSWYQFATAIAGGVIAILVSKKFGKI